MDGAIPWASIQTAVVWAIMLCGLLMVIGQYVIPGSYDHLATEGQGANPSLRHLVRRNWPYLLGAPIYGPYISFVSPDYGLPPLVDSLVLDFSLGLALVPVLRRKALPMFWFVSMVIWVMFLMLAAWYAAATAHLLPPR
jgi:hypothetical protein